MTTDPAKTLRTAARLLRVRAEAVADKEWFLDHEEADPHADFPQVHERDFRAEWGDDDRWRVGCWGPNLGTDDQPVHSSGWFVQGECKLGFAEWAAMMGPQLAEPLAAWLDHAAERMSVHDEEYPADGNSGAHALRLARELMASLG